SKMIIRYCVFIQLSTDVTRFIFNFSHMKIPSTSLEIGPKNISGVPLNRVGVPFNSVQRYPKCCYVLRKKQSEQIRMNDLPEVVEEDMSAAIHSVVPMLCCQYLKTATSKSLQS
ncbi:hypothetical protein WA026_020976, partial [Henosepilachna vigintioctopunctata]